MIDVVIATRNNGKIKECKELLKPLNLNIRSLSEFNTIGTIEETGTTFEENAAIKAKTVAEHTGLLTIADDSGLEVDELNGRPGVYSARFASENATDLQNNTKLLELLTDVPPSLRSARFVCAIALALPGQLLGTVKATCEGEIAEELRGHGGFGYDPLFIVRGYNMTFAELSLDLKNKVSHRAKALNKAVIFLEKLMIEDTHLFQPRTVTRKTSREKEDI